MKKIIYLLFVALMCGCIMNTHASDYVTLRSLGLDSSDLDSITVEIPDDDSDTSDTDTDNLVSCVDVSTDNLTYTYMRDVHSRQICVYGPNGANGMTFLELARDSSMTPKMKKELSCYILEAKCCDPIIPDDEYESLVEEFSYDENIYVIRGSYHDDVWFKMGKDEFKYMYETKLKKYVTDFASKYNLKIIELRTVWK